jgi:hypothetical protein
MAIQFPTTGSFSFTDLTLEPANFILPEAYTSAKLIFRVSDLPANTAITVSNIVVRGDGITNTLNIPSTVIDSTRFISTDLQPVNVPGSSFDSLNNRVSFDIEVDGELTTGTTLSYYFQYWASDYNFLSPRGNVTLVAASESE